MDSSLELYDRMSLQRGSTRGHSSVALQMKNDELEGFISSKLPDELLLHVSETQYRRHIAFDCVVCSSSSQSEELMLATIKNSGTLSVWSQGQASDLDPGPIYGIHSIQMES